MLIRLHWLPPSLPSLLGLRLRVWLLRLLVAMGGSFSRMFSKKIDRNILLLGRQGVGKTYLLYRLKGLTTSTVGTETRDRHSADSHTQPRTRTRIRPSSPSLTPRLCLSSFLFVPFFSDLLPTHAFNHFEIDFHQFERQIEVWDPSGKPSHASFWSTFYTNVYFHVVIYVIDAAMVSQGRRNTGRAWTEEGSRRAAQCSCRLLISSRDSVLCVDSCSLIHQYDPLDAKRKAEAIRDGQSDARNCEGGAVQLLELLASARSTSGAPR